MDYILVTAATDVQPAEPELLIRASDINRLRTGAQDHSQTWVQFKDGSERLVLESKAAILAMLNLKEG